MALIWCHTGSRLVAVWMIRLLPYGGDLEHAKAKLNLKRVQLVVANRAQDAMGSDASELHLVDAHGVVPPAADAEKTAAGYEFYPQALGHTVRFAAARTGKPIYVTENGIATDEDSRRIAYIGAMRRAAGDH